VLLAVILVGLFAPLVSRRRQRAREAVVAEREQRTPRDVERRALQLDGASAFSLLMVLLFAWALWQSRDFGLRAGLFPWAVCIPGLVLGLAQLTRDLTGRRAAPEPVGEAAPAVPAEVATRRTITICLWILGFWIAIWLLGFSLATLLMTFCYLRVSARERWPITLVLTAAASAFVYGVFEKALSVPFPSGQLFVWLGLV
jgi:putative tricarboxylic transport membrane protein